MNILRTAKRYVIASFRSFHPFRLLRKVVCVSGLPVLLFCYFQTILIGVRQNYPEIRQIYPILGVILTHVIFVCDVTKAERRGGSISHIQLVGRGIPYMVNVIAFEVKHVVEIKVCQNRAKIRPSDYTMQYRTPEKFGGLLIHNGNDLAIVT